MNSHLLVIAIAFAALGTLSAHEARACIEDDSLILEDTPGWNEDGTRFGWFCDEKDHPDRKCRKPKISSAGLLPSGAGEFHARNELRTEETYEDLEDEKGDWVGIEWGCEVRMRSKLVPGAPEIIVSSWTAGKQADISDSLCVVHIAPGGGVVGLGYGWASDESVEYRVRFFTFEDLESRYWNALAARSVDEDPQVAATYWEHALWLDGSLWEARVELARCAVLDGDHEAAFLHLAAAIALHPAARKLVKKDDLFAVLRDEDDWHHLFTGKKGLSAIAETLGSPPPLTPPPETTGEAA